MTKFKVCKKIHLFIIISVLLIAIGMAVGTVCHYIANGFFNYGGEYSSYKSVTVSYYYSEQNENTDIDAICEEAFADVNAISVSTATSDYCKEITYKFSLNEDNTKLEAAVNAINAHFTNLESGATLHEGTTFVGGAKNIVYAAIAFASAAVFQFIYYVVRYKLRAAFSSILACVHNLGLYVALLAITRIPVGAEAIAMGGVVLFVTMILCGILFDRTRKNFNNEKYAKTDRLEVVDTSACEVRMVTFTVLVALAIAAVVLGAFSAIAAAYIGAFMLGIVALLGVVACAYGMLFFTPAVHGAIDACCQGVGSHKGAKSATKKQPEAVQTEDNSKE